MMLVDFDRRTADIPALVALFLTSAALSSRIPTFFAFYSTSVAVSSAISADDCRSVRVLRDDQPFYGKGDSRYPFHYGPVVNVWHACHDSASSSLGFPPSGRSVVAPVTVTDCIDRLKVFFDAERSDAMHHAGNNLKRVNERLGTKYDIALGA